ncbi:MAG: diguanylate cyclase [Hydrogenovibrio sp.]|uniref:sensor domain-containing diguanylate cyclase n=1 Tax=Hydrogenovibrio sp. TaxID=2065821 RepID=UPI0028709311|nr:diguanylate cyclase [Hydrogenovibrio sp.]MDR9499470.1 diguanylate cyclase [Hydrogenovibrio sp.]
MSNMPDHSSPSLKILPSLSDRMAGSSDLIISNWVEAPDVVDVLLSHHISIANFESDYAREIFHYFIDIISQRHEVGHCPALSKLVSLCIDEDITVSDVYKLCVHFRESIVAFLLDADVLDKPTYKELCYIFDANLSGLLQDYAATIAENKRAKESFKAIIEKSLNEIYIFDQHSLKFTYANRGAQENTGYPLDELKSMHPYDLKPNLTQDQFLQLIAPVLQRKKERLVFEELHQRKDGSTYDADIRLQMMEFDNDEHLVAIVNDVTEQKYAHQINRNYQINNAIINNSSDAIICVDANQRITLFNPSAERTFGFTAIEVIGQPLGVLLPDGFQERHENFVNEFGKGTTTSTKMTSDRPEVQGKRKNGTLFPVEASISKAVVEGRLMFTALVRDVSERHAAEAEIRRLAKTDWLTGLYNRHHFESSLKEAVSYTERFPEHKTGLFLIDLDHFKLVNDSYGHKAGDELLKNVAEILKENIRQIDIVGRLGGDEFGIIARGINDPSDMIQIAENIADKLAILQKNSESDALISLSIGMTFCPDQGSDLEQLMVQADKALYQAKDGGRNQYKLYTPNF